MKRISILAVIGAGPKALAIAVKRKVLLDLGCNVPDLCIIERHEIGANWSGRFGYTDGHQLLGTSPHKDVGFPYRSREWSGASPKVTNAEVNARMRQYSWDHFLVTKGEYDRWIDRGMPQPVHSQWCDYMGWVAKEVDFHKHLQIAEVKEIDLAMDKRWRLGCKDGRTCEADGLVVTGPGEPRRISKKSSSRILDGKNCWQQLAQLAKPGKNRTLETVAVIGTGETAASVTVALLKVLAPHVNVTICGSTLYSRGESFFENKMFTDPDTDWQQLSIEQRKSFIKRTDRGVFSVHAMDDLRRADRVMVISGKVKEILDEGGQELYVVMEHGGRTAASLVIDASGFNDTWFMDLMSHSAKGQLTTHLNNRFSRDELELRIGRDLSVDGFKPYLHLPMLAGLSQGPGFPNLSSLGMLSDRILRSHVD